MATRFIVSSLVLVPLISSSIASAATFSIPSGTAPFTPSFRAQPDTTYFGWSSGSFDQTVDNELIDSPPTTLGGAAGANLIQNDTQDILSGSNNVYIGGGTLDLTVTAPTSGTPGTGFTTLIVQGRTAFGPFGTDGDPVFADINGIAATVVRGLNAASAGQFWAKYEIPGNASTYDIGITGGGFFSLNTLVVDTQWSSTGYALDTAVVPEPAMLTVASLASLVLVRRRHSR